MKDSESEPRWLLGQYYEGLRVSFLVAKQKAQSEAHDAVVEKIEKLFMSSQNGQSWGNAYEIEQCLTYLYDDEMLDEQLHRRLIDLELHSDPERYRRFRDRSEQAGQKRSRQELLREVTSNVQWYYRKRDARRDYCRKARINALKVFIGALILFTISLVVSHSEWPLKYTSYDPTTRVLIIGICAGFLGASFSVLLGLKTKLAEASIEDLRILNELSYMALRPFIGVGAALIFFFLVQSKLLGGQLFPNLPITLSGNQSLMVHYASISKMIVWCFISGFSEHFVPSLLKGTESHVGDEQEATITKEKDVT